MCTALNISLRSCHVEYDCGLQSTSRCIWPMVSSPYSRPTYPYTAHITNEEVRSRTGQPPVTLVIDKRRLHLFGHLARADPSQDHLRILRAAINRPPADWRRRAGRPRRTLLRTIELDLRPHNLDLNTAWMCAQDRSKWRQLVETAMLNDGHAEYLNNVY